MQRAAALQRPVLYSTQVWTRHKGRAGGAKARPASLWSDPCAFLNTTVGEIAVSDTELLNVDLKNGYEGLVGGLRRFYRMVGHRFREPQKGSLADRFCVLIGQTEKDMKEIGIEFCVWKHVDDNEMNFTLYRHVGVMDEALYTFYLSPCDTLKGEMSDLYKRYIRYIGDCFGINITIDGSCNYYVDMIMNMLFEDFYDEETEEPCEKKMLDFYQKGHGYDLFNEVNELIVSPNELRRDLELYREKANGDELTMVEVMLDGMNILPYMSIYRYDFNPLCDGFETGDGYIEVYNCIAFVYSGYDGLEEQILDCINNDCNCGLYPVGWNKWMHLENFTNDDFDFLMSDNSKQREFVEWTNKWYSIERKFDKEYGTD